MKVILVYILFLLILNFLAYKIFFYDYFSIFLKIIFLLFYIIVVSNIFAKVVLIWLKK